ncbi:MAG: hypothetical protein COA69_04850 [Robiginitomaculum sp.]|nr:MAG: hypothetical protein COA69_04850 [Robiginitomaculum sp.]
MDRGEFKQVAVQPPREAVLSARPTRRPHKYAPATRPAPRAYTPKPYASQFDQASVDPDLYKHQRIGKRYTILGKSYTPKHQPYYNKVGTASWYGDKFHGRPTATGELYDMDDVTAAHKTLPLNSMVYVTNLQTGQGMLVRVNDRGPFVDGRIIDLSRESARRLGLFESGIGAVRVQYAGPADPNAAKTNKRPIKRPSTPKLRKQKPSYDMVAELQKALPKFLPKRKPLTMPKLTPNYEPLRNLGKPQITPPASRAALQRQVELPKKRKPKFSFQKKEEYVNPLLEGNQGNTYTRPSTPQRTAQLPKKAPKNLSSRKSGQKNLSPSNLEWAPSGTGPVTLTIKGPIHLAASKNDSTQKQPKFIPAVNYTKKPAEE